MNLAFIALGSNLANPVEQVQDAFEALDKIPNTHVLKKSSLYQTSPIDCQTDTPDFINAVAGIETELTPQSLLEALHTIEAKAGRERPYVNAPRVLDCDLLLYENIILNTATLTVPHPRMHTRGFVLLPLSEIAPDINIPNHGKISQLIGSSQFTDIKKLSL